MAILYKLKDNEPTVEDPSNPFLKFSNELKTAVEYASKEIAVELANSPSDAFGVESRITKTSTGDGGMWASKFSKELPASHSHSYARHFASVAGKTVRMDFGNLVEQRAYELMKKYTEWQEELQFLYQVAVAVPHKFPINYTGTFKDARPDFRFSLGCGEEGVVDITTQLEHDKLHVLDKTVDNTKLGNHSKIPKVYEIVWEDKDFWKI